MLTNLFNSDLVFWNIAHMGLPATLDLASIPFKEGLFDSVTQIPQKMTFLAHRCAVAVAKELSYLTKVVDIITRFES